MPFVPTKQPAIDYAALYPAARKVVTLAKLKPQPLDMTAPDPRNQDLVVCMRLAPAHPQWLAMIRGWISSYARAGMNIDLCEYAAARDAVKGLGL